MPSDIIKKPVITEKSSRLNEIGQYVFRVGEKSSKNEIKKIVSKLYNVHVEKVSITSIPPKPRRYRGMTQNKPGYKKAVVTLKKGEVINI